MKPYRVDFKYSVESEASMYVCAANEKDAAKGAIVILENTARSYRDPEITKVEEVVKEAEAETTEKPILN